MQIYLGSLYVNDFNKFGRTYSVRVQADAQFRARADDVGQLKVRSRRGEMVPLVRAAEGAGRAPGRSARMRYNGFLAGRHQRRRRRPASRPARRRPRSRASPPRRCRSGFELRVDRADLSGDPRRQFGVVVFPLAILLVFLVLAALYESLTLPLSIIMIVPMGLLAAMTGVWLTGGDNNIFTQIGLIVLVGLVGEERDPDRRVRARARIRPGARRSQAAIEASRLRLRPILMTSLAFIMGVVPLVISTGAGAEMRHAMGVAVFAGMIGVTLFGIFLTPVFYVLLRG